MNPNNIGFYLQATTKKVKNFTTANYMLERQKIFFLQIDVQIEVNKKNSWFKTQLEKSDICTVFFTFLLRLFRYITRHS